ncbi:MAG TPA: methylated-DNA--[protein]-cysteine S-methyltransferase [Dongiaceae bacterium]
MSNAILQTEIGWIDVGGNDSMVTRLHWHSTKPREIDPTPLLREAARQLDAYVTGDLRTFDLPLQADGSDFAKSVWREMLAIPYGRTLTYGDVAAKLKVPAQLVGQACGQNPIAVIIPCHRILGATSLGGYTSELGLRAKTFLLDLERGQGTLF